MGELGSNADIRALSAKSRAVSSRNARRLGNAVAGKAEADQEADQDQEARRIRRHTATKQPDRDPPPAEDRPRVECGAGATVARGQRTIEGRTDPVHGSG